MCLGAPLLSHFHLQVEATLNNGAGADPLLEVWLAGALASSATVGAAGANTLQFDLTYTGYYPTSMSLRFNGTSGDGNETITINAVRINGQDVNAADLTATILAQGQQADLNNIANYDHDFGRTEPSAGDLGAPTQTGTGGADTINGSTGDDVIDGGNGADRIRGLGSDDAINGGTGDDMIFGEAGNDIIIGGDGDDKLYGNEGDDLLHGQLNNDTIIGGDGNDVLNGGDGDDSLLGDAGDDILFGEAGNDRLIGGAGENRMYGDAGDDVLIGGIGNDIMFGGNDNDQVNGANGDDEVYGNDGDDLITGGNGNDALDGGAGTDSAFGGAGDDAISGGDGNDSLYGDAGDDALNGDNNDDNLIGGDGADTLNGGDGNDLLQGSGLTSQEVSIILAANPGVVFSEETGSFYKLVSSNATFTGAQGAAGVDLNGVSGHLVTISSSIENTFVDALASGSQVWINASDGGVEGEWRWAGGQEDGLLLWNGDQTGSAANGFYENWAAGQPGGGNANDAAVMLSDGTWDDVSATAAHYYIIEWDGADFSDDNAVDTLNGGNGNDLLLGNGGNDILNGDVGTDHVFGGAGDDTVSGGGDNDFLYDDTGANTFYGDAGDDLMDARFQTAIPSIADQITTLLTENPGLNYSTDTGNFYALTTGNYTFAQAIAGSSADLLNGVAGHLSTITSAEENTFISTIRLGNEIWIGASDDTAYTGDVEGHWYWIVGPEAGTYFYDQSTGLAIGTNFIAWDAGEPNDYVNGEDAATMWQGGDRWNDNGPPNDNAFRADYITEWEGSLLLVTPPAEAPQANQLMYGGAGNDIAYGGNGDDTIYGEDDNDTLYGFIGSDTIYGGNGADVLYAHDDPGVTALPLDTSFNADENGLSYIDGFTTVGGGDPANVDVTGSWINTDGYAPGSGNGAIQINMDSTGNPTSAISGNYGITVNLSTSMSEAQLSFAYRMNLFTAADNNENLYLYVTIDDVVYGAGGNNWVDSRLGNSSEGDSGWLTTTLDLDGLAAGNHTIRIGLYVNDVSDNTEDAWIRLDDIILSNAGAPPEDPGAVNVLDGGAGNDTLYGSTASDTLRGGNDNDTLRSGSEIVIIETTVASAAFAASEDGFAYADLNDPANVTISGTWDNTDGYPTSSGGSGNGSILVDMVTSGTAADVLGAYSITMNLTDAVYDGQLTFAYRMNLDTSADGGENLYAIAAIDTTTLGSGAVGSPFGTINYFDSRIGNSTEGNSGWRTITIDVGDLTAGSHTISLGMYVNDVSNAGENGWIRFDDVSLTGNVIDDSVMTSLNGQDGLDTLYGSDGIDHFIFEAASAFNNIDVINNFDISEGDAIDLSDILSGVNAGNVTSYVQITTPSTVNPVTVFSANFAAGNDGFAAADGFSGFGAGDPGGSDNGGNGAGNNDVNETRLTTDGTSTNTSLEVYVDGRNGTGSTNASGNWSMTFNAANALTNVQLDFSYRHYQDGNTDNGENSTVYLLIDGVRYGLGGNDYVSQTLGTSANTTDHNTGWQTVTNLSISNLSAGSHTIAFGIFQNAENDATEDSYVRIDDIVLTGDETVLSGNSEVRVDATGSGNFGAGSQVATIMGTTGLTDEAALLASGNLIV